MFSVSKPITALLGSIPPLHHHLTARVGAQTLRLTGGDTVRIRPMCAADAPQVCDVLHGMGDRSHYTRFQSCRPPQANAYLHGLAHKIARDTAACGRGWLAFTRTQDGTFTAVAKARYMPLAAAHLGVGRAEMGHPDKKCAEIAFSVADASQGKGIGTRLLRLMVAQARKEKYGELVAHIHESNFAMQVLLYKSGLPVSFEPHGPLLRTTVQLTPSF